MSKSFRQSEDEYFNLKKRKFRERRTQKLKKPKNGKTVDLEIANNAIYHTTQEK